MITPNRLREAAEWLSTARAPLLMSHRRPDGDALGCLAAMSMLMRARGATPRVALFDPLPTRYKMLEGAADWHAWAESGNALAGACDSLIILDTCAAAQLEPAAPFLAAAPRTLVIDHHATRDAGIGNRPGDLRVIDPAAGACALLVQHLCESMDAHIDAPMAMALFVGLATDTGWFRFSNADAHVLAAASRLIAAGAKPNEIYEALYQQDPAARLRLIGRLLSGMELHAGGAIVLLRLRQADFAASGADRSMTEDLVNEAGRLAGVEATLLMTEEADGTIRANLRSRRTLDVAALAARHGGGGHQRAAGCRMSGDFEAAARTLIEQATEALQTPQT